jgi:hypothetical protein
MFWETWARINLKTLCGKIEDILTVKAGGTYSYHFAL